MCIVLRRSLEGELDTMVIHSFFSLVVAAVVVIVSINKKEEDCVVVVDDDDDEVPLASVCIGVTSDTTASHPL